MENTCIFFLNLFLSVHFKWIFEAFSMKLSSSTLIFVIIMFSKMWFFKILAAILQSPFCKGRKRTESPLVSSFEWNNGVNAQASITTSLRERLPFVLKWVEKMVRRWAWEAIALCSVKCNHFSSTQPCGSRHTFIYRPLQPRHAMRLL